MAATVGSLRIELSASIAQFQQDMGKATSAVKQVGAEFTKFGNDFKKIASQLESVGLALSKTITLPFASISVAALKMSTDINASMANIATLIPQSTARILELKSGVQSLAIAMGKSTSDMAGGLYELVSSIGDSADSMAILGINAKAGAAGLATTKEAINFTTAVTKTYGDVSAAAFQKVSDLGFQAVNFGKTTFPELAAAIGGVAPIAQVAGVSMEEMFAVIATATGVTGNTSEVVTQMASALTGLLSPSKEMKTAFRGLGVASGEALIAERGFVGALQAVAAQAKATGTPIIDLVGRKEAFILTASLAGAQAGAFTDRMKDMAQAAGATDTAFKAQTDGINKAGFTWKQFQTQIEVVGEKFGDALAPAFLQVTKLLQSMLPFVDKAVAAFVSLPQGVQASIIGVAGFAAVLGPAIWFSGQLVSSLAQLTLAFGKNGIATRAMLGSIGLVEKGLGALGSAVVVDGAVMFEWGKSTVSIGGWIGKLGAAVGTLASGGLGPLTAAFEVAGGAIAAIFSPVTLVIGGFVALGLALAAATGHWDDVKAAMGGVVQVVKDLGTVFGFFAKGVLADVVTGLISLAKWLGGEIVSGFQWLVTTVGALIAPFTDLATVIAGPVISAIGGLIGWVGKLASGAKDLVVNGVKDLHDYAEAIRLAAENAAFGKKFVEDFWKSVDSRGKVKEIQSAAEAFDLLKKQLSGLKFGGGSNGFADLMNSLKAARAELAALSSTDLARLTEAVKSGAFSMKEIEEATGLSDMALKLFQDQVRESGKTLKEQNSIFDDYRKKVAELTTGLTEGLKFDVPVDFIKRLFGPMIRDVEDMAADLGKTVPQIINDAFLKITIKDATDNLQKQFVKFGEELNAQVGKDMERVNATVIKTLSVIVEAGQSTADSAAQFSIEGLKNEIKNLEAATGETKKSLDLRKQLYAEEYQYQVNLIQREGQAKKDALDKNGEFYRQALDAIDQMTASKMGLASQIYRQKIKEMQASTKSWKDSLGELASAFSSIASSSSGAFAGVAKEIGSVISALGNATKAAKDFQKATQDYQIAVDKGDTAGQYAAIGNKVAAIANGIAAVAQATSAKNPVAAVAGGAISGGVTGAAIGSVVPGIGTGIGFGVGAGVGALVGWIRSIYKGPAEKAALDVGRDFGVVISEGLAKELADLGKRVGRQAAGIFDLDKIIAEGGGLRSTNIEAYTKKLRDTFVMVKTGALTAADGAVVLDKNFANFANQFLANGPLISKELVDIVRLTDDLGAKSKAVSDFIAGQIDSKILPGLQAFTGASKTATDALVESQKKLKDLQGQLGTATDPEAQATLKKQIADVTDEISKQQGIIAATAITSQGAATAIGATVAVAFAEMMKAGTPILDIVAKLTPVMAGLNSQFAAAGFSGGAAFAKIQGLVSTASDEIAGPAIQAMTGLGQTMAGLSNIGQLDQSTFTGLSDQIASTFNSLISQGKSGGDVLALMQQPLQTIWELSTDFGYAVDDSTRALLDQAIAAGEVGEKFKTPQQQMIDALAKTNDILGSIAKALGATLPDAAKAGAQSVKDAFKDVNPKVKVDIQYNDPGFTPSTPDYTPPSVAATGGYVRPWGVQHFDQGGIVKGLFQPKGTDTVPAMLTPGEVVLNQDQQGALRSALAALSAAAAQAMTALAASMSTSLPIAASAAAKSIDGIATATDAAVASSVDAIRKLGAAMGFSMATGASAATESIGDIPTATSTATAQAINDVSALAAAMGMKLSRGATTAADSIDGISKATDAATDAAAAALAALKALARSEGFKIPVVSPAATGGLVTPLGVQHFDQGGLVKGLFQPKGTDTVPAMLTPGELVLNRDQQALIASALAPLGSAGDAGAQAFLKAIRESFADLPNEAKITASAMADAFTSIKLPTIHIPVEYGNLPKPPTPSSGAGDQALPGIPIDWSGHGDIVHGQMAYLQGSDGIFHDSQLADQRGSAQPAASDTFNVSLNVNALDAASFREMMTRPGGGADLIIDSISQGKRGRDEKLRRGLALAR